MGQQMRRKLPPAARFHKVFAAAALAVAAGPSVFRVGSLVASVAASSAKPAKQSKPLADAHRHKDGTPEFTREELRSGSWQWENAYRLNRAHRMQFQHLGEDDGSGLTRLQMHPNHLHVGRSACRIGAVVWSEVRRLALQAESGAALPPVTAVFEHCEGKGSPLRILTGPASLHASYAALLVDSVLEVRHSNANVSRAHFEQYGDDAYLADVYCPRVHDAAKGSGGPLDIFLARRPVPGHPQRELALVDPQATRSLVRKMKPHWPKAWAFARRMLEGEEFPPLPLSWRLETCDWRWKDGCHRFFAALISGRFLNVRCRLPRPPRPGAEGVTAL